MQVFVACSIICKRRLVAHGRAYVRVHGGEKDRLYLGGLRRVVDHQLVARVAAVDPQHLAVNIRGPVEILLAAADGPDVLEVLSGDGAFGAQASLRDLRGAFPSRARHTVVAVQEQRVTQRDAQVVLALVTPSRRAPPGGSQAQRATRGGGAQKLAFLVMLEGFQRPGCFPKTAGVPGAVVAHLRSRPGLPDDVLTVPPPRSRRKMPELVE